MSKLPFKPKRKTPARVAKGRSPSKKSAATPGAQGPIEADLLHTRQALAAALAWQGAILDSAGLSIIATDPQGVIRTFNRSAERMLGYRADEVVGKTHPMAIYDAGEVNHRAGELSRELGRVIKPGFEVFVAKARLGEAEERDWTYRRKGGERFPVRLTVSAVFDAAGQLAGFMGIATDLTERHREEERLRHIVEAAPNALLIVSQTGQITLANAQAEKLFGYARAELIGRPVETLLPKRFRAAFPRQRDRYFAQPRPRTMNSGHGLYGLHKDRREIPVEIGLNPFETQEGTFVLASIVDITERRQADALLRQQASLLDLTTEAILTWTEDGVITYWNQGATDLYGYTAQEAMGCNSYELLKTQLGPGLPAVLDTLRSHGSWSGALTHVSKQGTVLSIESNMVMPLMDGPRLVLETNRDVTARKLAEAALQETERRLSDLFDNTSDLIQSVSPEGKFLFVNAAWYRTLGYGHEDLDTITMFDVIDPESRDHCHEMFAKVMSGEQLDKLEVRFRTKDGRTLDLEGNASCQFKDGRPIATRAIFHDVTERQRREAATRALNEALERQAAELTAAKSRAESADRLKSAFLATMSHELRTPLNSILGFTGIILQGLTGPLNPEQTKQLGMVQGSARHLLALINDVLDISKIEAGEVDVALVPFDLSASISKVIGIVAPLAEQKGLALRVDVATGIGELVSDARRVEQVLLNLVNNAIKFTQQGEVALKALMSGNGVLMKISDSGIGIKPEDLQALFQPFRQIDAGIGRVHEGTGLGLAISRRLAGLLGGEISVTSEWGKGSTFSFQLPLNAPKTS